MKVRIKLPLNKKDKKQINRVTVELNHLPRIGELISLDLKTEDGQEFCRQVRVEDVIWSIQDPINGCYQYVTLITK